MGLSKVASVAALLLVVSGCAGMGAKKKTLLRADTFIQAAEQDLAAARAAQADKFAADLFQRAQIDLGAAQSARQEQRGDDAIREAEGASRWARAARVAADSARRSAQEKKPAVSQAVPTKKTPAKIRAR